jgi:hypothetical protein
MKKCNDCKNLKQFIDFNKDSRAKDGLCLYCRDCRKSQKKKEYSRDKENILSQQKKYRDGNKQAIKERSAKFRAKNGDKIRARQNEAYHKEKEKRLDYARKRYAENKEVIKGRVKQYCKENRSKVAAIKAKYRAAKYQATPNWLTKKHLQEIEEFYTLAQELAWLNEGEVLQVDHIVPLQGKDICGLHVPWNLQILTKADNIRKFNKLISC